MLVLILAACSPDPAKIASRYVDALDAGKIDEAYAMLCASDRRTRSTSRSTQQSRGRPP
jgi:hypothetical protein